MSEGRLVQVRRNLFQRPFNFRYSASICLMKSLVSWPFYIRGSACTTSLGRTPDLTILPGPVMHTNLLPIDHDGAALAVGVTYENVSVGAVKPEGVHNCQSFRVFDALLQ